MENNKNFSHAQKMKAIHPGTILRMELIDGRNLSIEQIAETTKIPLQHVEGLFEGVVSISSEIATKIASNYGGTSEHFIRLQKNYDKISETEN